ncbi:two-component transcription regulator OmpR subfamily protein [Microcystis aeruginosa NIES-3806]|nr:two-component transcription regulator OmpR subfamily protein [Microcystis aeruginosa NIES-3806]
MAKFPYPELTLEYIRSSDYDLLLLDVMLPQLDGISFCQQLRSRGDQMPILMVTARYTVSDKISGLDAGADDYIVKPVDLGELFARVRALLRRNVASLPPILEWGHLRLDPGLCRRCHPSHPQRILYFRTAAAPRLSLNRSPHHYPARLADGGIRGGRYGQGSPARTTTKAKSGRSVRKFYRNRPRCRLSSL